MISLTDQLLHLHIADAADLRCPTSALQLWHKWSEVYGESVLMAQ